jgi:hypothetical protein
MLPCSLARLFIDVEPALVGLVPAGDPWRGHGGAVVHRRPLTLGGVSSGYVLNEIHDKNTLLSKIYVFSTGEKKKKYPKRTGGGFNKS